METVEFPTVSKSHILHCSYHYWYPKYRQITPKSRLIPLSDAFLNYLRSDGIFLPPEPNQEAKIEEANDEDGGIISDWRSEDESEKDEEADPSREWIELHKSVKETIAELDGKVVPKLNWSSPKDAIWISGTNDMCCRSANDVYILLKSSNFVTHDLYHAFNDCVSSSDSVDSESGNGFNAGGSANDQLEPDMVEQEQVQQASEEKIPYHLVLRKYFEVQPSLEFRCFVQNRRLVGLCQRDPNYFDFLLEAREELRARIRNFFITKLRDTFPDPDFVFDVYVAGPQNRVWLMDINPWAPRTDPLLFSWSEMLKLSTRGSGDRVTLPGVSSIDGVLHPEPDLQRPGNSNSEEKTGLEGAFGFSKAMQEAPFLPELRLVGRDDPEAFSFAAPQYSAHKKPKDVVDASTGGSEDMRSFLNSWQDVLAKKVEEDEAGSSDGG